MTLNEFEFENDLQKYNFDQETLKWLKEIQHLRKQLKQFYPDSPEPNNNLDIVQRLIKSKAKQLQKSLKNLKRTQK